MVHPRVSPLISLLRVVVLALALAAAMSGTARADGPEVLAETRLVPVRDGTTLFTKVFRDPDGAPRPVVLMRTPYPMSGYQAGTSYVAECIDHGYALVVQNTRGRFFSSGTDSTFWTDGWGANRDGFDTVEWIADQPWCDGNVGMFGGSALGITQLLAAGAAPPALRACVVLVAAPDFYAEAFFQGGVFRERLVEGWMSSQGSFHMVPFFTAHPTREPFWDLLDLGTVAEGVTVPIVHVGGHYDVFGEGAIDGFARLQDGGGEGARGRQRLVLGPWQHRGAGLDGVEQGELVYPGNSLYDYRTLRWAWFDRWLEGIENGVDEAPPVEVYLMGDVDDPSSAGNRWVELDAWPPATSDVPFFLHPDGVLSPTPPVAATTRSFVHDPGDPIPTLGGRNLNIPAGPHDQRPLAGRPDQIVATSPVLPEAVTVMGKVRAIVHLSSDAPDTDVAVKLVDVYPDGREMLVTDGIRRVRTRYGYDLASHAFLGPDSLVRVEVDLWSTAIAFDAGHRIQVVIASSNWPRFHVNPGDGRPFGEDPDPRTATNTIHLGGAHATHLLLPVVGEPTVAVGDAPATAAAAGGPSLVGSLRPGPRFTLTLEHDVPGWVSARVYAVDGREVAILADRWSPGALPLRWTGRGAGGVQPAGVYLLDVEVGDGGRLTRRLTLLP